MACYQMLPEPVIRLPATQAPGHPARRDGVGQRTTYDGAAWQNMWGGRMQKIEKAGATADTGELMLIMNSNQV